MSGEGLSKQEVIWSEMMEMEGRLKVLVSMLNQSEKNVGNTVTSIEESLEVIHKQLHNLSDTTNGVMDKKEKELQQRIDAALAESFAASEKRDMEVIETISAGVGEQIASSVETVAKTFSAAADEVAVQVRSAGIRAFAESDDAGRAKWVAVAVVLVLLLVVSVGGGAWYVAGIRYDDKARELGFRNAGEAEAALTLSRLNNLTQMVGCVGFAEHRQNGHTYCVPMDKDKVVSGWRIK